MSRKHPPACHPLRDSRLIYSFQEGKLLLLAPNDESLPLHTMGKLLQDKLLCVLSKMICGYLDECICVVAGETDRQSYVGEYCLCVSFDNRYVCVTEKYGLNGWVADTWKRKIIKKIEREDYHAKFSVFSVTFIEKGEKTKFIYSDKWNNLCILNVENWEKDEKDLDMGNYFTGALTPSPDSKYVVDSGWVWGSFGSPLILSMDKWNTGDRTKITKYVDIIDYSDHHCPSWWINNDTFAIASRNFEEVKKRQNVQIMEIQEEKEMKETKRITIPESFDSKYRMFWNSKLQLLLICDDSNGGKCVALDIKEEKYGSLKNVCVVGILDDGQGSIVIFEGGKLKTWNISREQLLSKDVGAYE